MLGGTHASRCLTVLCSRPVPYFCQLRCFTVEEQLPSSQLVGCRLCALGVVAVACPDRFRLSPMLTLSPVLWRDLLTLGSRYGIFICQANTDSWNLNIQGGYVVKVFGCRVMYFAWASLLFGVSSLSSQPCCRD